MPRSSSERRAHTVRPYMVPAIPKILPWKRLPFFSNPLRKEEIKTAVCLRQKRF